MEFCTDIHFGSAQRNNQLGGSQDDFGSSLSNLFDGVKCSVVSLDVYGVAVMYMCVCRCDNDIL